jgi:vacuolar-type H+-ATPase subunit H
MEPATDIIARVREAEAEAVRLVHAAEEARREAVLAAEAAAGLQVAEAGNRARSGYEASLARAEAEAAAIVREAETRAAELDDSVTEVLADRMAKAVQRLVAELKRQWQ